MVHKIVNSVGNSREEAGGSFRARIDALASSNGVVVFAFNPKDKSYAIGAHHQEVLDQLPEGRKREYVVGSAVKLGEFKSESPGFNQGLIQLEFTDFGFRDVTLEALKAAAAFLVEEGVNPDKELVFMDSRPSKLSGEVEGIRTLRQLIDR